MKKTTILAAALLLMIGTTCPTQAQEVTLGDATFSANSDQVSTNWYLPLRSGVTNTFEGYGANAGLTKTEQFSIGETVAGVKTVKRHIEGSSPAVAIAGASPAVAVEDWWLAAGTNDDIRVLKLVRNGSVVFEATAVSTPPLLLPGTPTEGQTWEFFGATATIEWFATSFSGARVKVKQTSGTNVSSDYYHAGNGLMQTESDSSSGWRRRQ